jgi:hypothetical protein
MRQPVQFRQAAQAVQDAKAQQTPVSFANDIMPLFKQFQGPMMWRFDLTNYEAVVANAQTIYSRISSTSSPMPPAPFPPLSAAQIQTFQDWMNQGCPP